MQRASLHRRLLRILSALAVLATLAFAPAPAQAVGEPPPTTYARTVVLYPATALTGSGTVTSDSPRAASGVADVSKTESYAVADIFVTTDAVTSTVVTTIVQFSADQTNWVNATYTYVLSGSLTTGTYQLTNTNDATTYISVPLAGRYMRVSMQRTAAVTPVVTVVYRTVR